jgi:uncharacterized protein (DUF2267 family)
MERPVTITARHLALPLDLEAEIRDRAAGLERFYPRLIGCSVLVEGPGRRHRTGGPYEVRLDLRVPGAEPLSITRQHGERLEPAIAEAFDAATRQLEDLIRIQRGAVKRHETPAPPAGAAGAAAGPAAARPRPQPGGGAMTRVPAFDKAVQKAYEWLDEIDAELGWSDRERAYAALRGTLHAVRDRLPVDEAADLAAQLPQLVRGIYYEGWDPSATPVKVRHREDFLRPVADALAGRTGAEPEPAARAVLTVLARHLSAGEIADVVGSLPAELRELFPPAAIAAWQEELAPATA